MEFKIKLSNQKDKVIADESIVEALKNHLDSGSSNKGKKQTKSMKSKVYTVIACKHCFSDNRVETTDKKPICDTCGNELNI